MMTQTRAVLFDAGGTLVQGESIDAAISATLGHFAQTYGLACPPDALREAGRAAAAQAMRAALAQPFYLFQVVFRDAFARTFQSFGLAVTETQTGAMYDFLTAQLDTARPLLVDGARETLTALRERGVVTGVVSNSDEDHLPRVLDRVGLVDLVDFALSSEAARSCKPDPGIFRTALERAGCAADEALFVGDQPDQDIIGANRAGVRSVLYTGPGAALAGHIARSGLTGDAQPRHTITRLSDVLALVEP